MIYVLYVLYVYKSTANQPLMQLTRPGDQLTGNHAMTRQVPALASAHHRTTALPGALATGRLSSWRSVTRARPWSPWFLVDSVAKVVTLARHHLMISHANLSFTTGILWSCVTEGVFLNLQCWKPGIWLLQTSNPKPGASDLQNVGTLEQRTLKR